MIRILKGMTVCIQSIISTWNSRFIQLLCHSTSPFFPFPCPAWISLIWGDGHRSQHREGTRDSVGLPFPLLFWHRFTKIQQHCKGRCVGRKEESGLHSTQNWACLKKFQLKWSKISYVLSAFICKLQEVTSQHCLGVFF